MLDIPQLLSLHGRKIEGLLENEVPRRGVQYISDAVWYQFESGGKRLRPALCLITCEALGGDPDRALPFALATEVLHNFFLVHDDIEDGDVMRRDRETLWKRYGVPNAINIGDYLVAKGYDLILRAPLPAATNLKLARIFTTTFERTVEGQALDINLRGSPEVTLETYLRIVQLKTAYYLALTWVGGAVVAGVPDDALEPLWELGRCLGPAFQIRDDIIDMTQGKGRGGEVGCDLREGKPSICFAFVLDRAAGTAEERRRLIEIVARDRDRTTPDDVAWAIELYRRVGAIDFAQRTAEDLIRRAQDVIGSLPLDRSGKEAFSAISQFIIARNS
jgi:geranylgeranyl pyrophosphate synthase